MGKKVVIFSGIQKPTDKLSIDDVQGTGQLYSYYIRKEFEKLGIETVPWKCPSASYGDDAYRKVLKDLPDGDHVLCVEQRGFNNRRHIKFLIPEIRKKIKGKITTICDNNHTIGPADMLYYAVPAKEKPKSKYVGWAADPVVCRPDKESGTLRILIDHSYYGKQAYPDKSREIILDVVNFYKKYTKKNVIIRRFVSGGVETLDPKNFKFEIYNRKGLQYPDACKEYGKADIFIVTHSESMGLSVLESALSGALVITPKGYIKKELISPLHHIEVNGKIPWSTVLSELNVKKSVNMAKKYSWRNVAKAIAKDLYG
jgi:hypothetical protein